MADKSAILTVLDQSKGYQKLIRHLKISKHPIIPIPDEDTIRKVVDAKGDAYMLQVFQERANAIEMEARDPLRAGWEPQQWKDADKLLDTRKDILISGANRSGKSFYAAKRCVQRMFEKPGIIVWCLSTSHETSVRDQQKYIWKHLPPEWKLAAKNRASGCRILYGQARGFSDRVAVAPNGSEIRFMNYQQDREVIEGGQIDFWWADEIIPVDWVITLRGRTIDRRGQGLVTFTPVTGFTNTVSEYITGAKVVESVPCDLFPTNRLWPGLSPGRVPYIMESLNPMHAVIFFQAQQNPYIPYDELINVWKDKPMDQVLIRVHGLTKKSAGNAFPRFGVHNIVKPEAIPERGTNYQVIDFAWQKNWSMSWFRVVRERNRRIIYVYRDWPDFQSWGEWVVPSEKPDGAPGPAQETLGYSPKEYKQLIKTLEKGEPIFSRYGDPKSGGTRNAVTEEGNLTLFEMLEMEDKEIGPLIVEPVSSTDGNAHILHGVNLVNEWLEYNPDKPIEDDNRPGFYVSEHCQNTIDCMKLWSGRGGTKGAAKDFIDLLRYAAMMDIDYQDLSMSPSTGGGSY